MNVLGFKLRKHRHRAHMRKTYWHWFGTRGSEVQILSPRFYKAFGFQLVAATTEGSAISAANGMGGVLGRLRCSEAALSIAALTVSSSG